MAGRGAGLLGQIHRLWDLGTFAGLTDAQLLARFADRHEDGAELAFEALVERHGSMVFRVCRGVLGDEHAAEDAFQATFLVLARKARSLWVKDSLASWLHGVAHRVAARARVDAARRRRHEQQLAEARGPALEVMPDHPRSEAWAILSEEIARLPETYRAPVVLCYLEAMSYQAAAASLGVTEDTVRGRLARARERLRKSLARRGVEVPAIVAATRPAIPAVVVRHGLVQATARAAAGLSAGGAASLGALSRSVISLYERTCRTMMLTKLKVSAAAVVLGVVAAGAIVSAQQPKGGRAEPSGPATTETRPTKAVPAKGGNFIVDWIPADGQGGKKQITVDPTRHCIHLPGVSQKRDDRPNDGAVRVDLERGKVLQGHRRRRSLHERADRRRRRPLPRRGRDLPHRRGGLLRHSPDRPGAGEVDHVPVPMAHRPQTTSLPDGVLPRHLCPATPSEEAIRSPSRRPANRPPRSTRSRPLSTGSSRKKG